MRARWIRLQISHTTTSIIDTNMDKTTTGSSSKSGEISNYPLDFSIKQITSNASIVDSNYDCLYNKEMEGNNEGRTDGMKKGMSEGRKE